MQMTSAVWCQEPRPAVDHADATMTRAQSAARLSLDVTPGARLLSRVSTRCPRLWVVSPRSEDGATRNGGTRTGVAVLGVDSGTTEDDGADVGASSSRATGTDASRSELASAEGTSTGSRELDCGVFWQEESAFIAGLDK